MTDGEQKSLPPPARPLANTLAGKRIRVRKCGARLRVPAEQPGRETIYTCQLAKHDIDTPHQETGLVHMPNDTLRRYTMSWVDEGIAALRRHSKAKIRTVK